MSSSPQIRPKSAVLLHHAGHCARALRSDDSATAFFAQKRLGMTGETREEDEGLKKFFALSQF